MPIMFVKCDLFSWNGKPCELFGQYKGENPLRCTTQDEKGLAFNAIPFYPIFWSP